MNPVPANPNNLINSTPFEVQYRDGRKETVSVALLSIRQVYLFVERLAQTAGPELVALCTGQPVEWVDTLTAKSYGALHKQCVEQNFPEASEAAMGDPRLAAKLMPFLQDTQMLMTVALGAGLGLNNSSPAPASSESAAATGSASST